MLTDAYRARLTLCVTKAALVKKLLFQQRFQIIHSPRDYTKGVVRLETVLFLSPSIRTLVLFKNSNKGGEKKLKTFRCNRTRLCIYLMNKGFLPYAVEPDKTPRYKVYLFEETQALNDAVSQYIHKDSWTAKAKNYNKGEMNDEHEKEGSLLAHKSC